MVNINWQHSGHKSSICKKDSIAKSEVCVYMYNQSA